MDECPLGQVFMTGRSLRLHDDVFFRRDGSPVPITCSNAAYKRNGEFAGGVLIAKDVTDKRRVEEQSARLHASEEFNRRVLASSTDCIKVLDLEGRIEFMSQGGMCVMEVDDFAEIQGAYWLDFWTGDQRNLARNAVAQAKQGRTGHFQGDALTFRGNPRWWDVVVTPMAGPDGQPEKLLAVSRDVTATKVAELALRELNETLERRVATALAEQNMLATLVEATDVMIMALDFDYNILALNPATLKEFERIYGVRPEVGDNVMGFLAGKTDEQEQIRALWSPAFGGEHVTLVEEFGDPDLVRPYHEIKLRPLYDATGKQIGAFEFVTDVTDRLRQEHQLAEAQEALRQSQKMEAMGQLTGGVAHDFNNLLTPIIGSLDMLQRKQLGSAREQRLIAGAMQSAERAKTLVQRLLAFARRQPLQSVPVDVGLLITGMGELISSTAGPQIEVVMQAPQDLAPAMADPNQLEMALLNLAVNARDAMSERGGTLRISARQEKIRRKHPHLEVGQYVCLSVADTGSGMDKATLSRAVEPFFSTKGVGKGTGLGLSMVHGLASQMGGTLTIQSEVGQGTTVELWLPCSEVAATSDGTQAGSSPTSSIHRGTALLVEDDDLVRLSTADMLEELGYVVTEASSGEEALRVLQGGERINLLVTDHLMPGISGTELAHEVRAISPGLPVLLVSGYAEVEGVDPELPRLIKPFRRDELASSIGRIVNRPHPG
jgi:PAS domain S-box-containing protein